MPIEAERLNARRAELQAEIAKFARPRSTGSSPQTAADGTAHPVAITIAETAAILQCSRQHVHHLINRGELRRYKVGRLTRLNTQEVLAMVGAAAKRQ